MLYVLQQNGGDDVKGLSRVCVGKEARAGETSKYFRSFTKVQEGNALRAREALEQEVMYKH